MKIYVGIIVNLLISSVGYTQDTTRLSMLFVGDIMGHDSQIEAAYTASTNSYNYESCFRFIEPIISSVDVAFGNLEVTLAGKPYKGYPQFSSPDELAVALKAIGFDVLVTANNHSLDRRKSGLERTIRVLDSLDILHTGTFIDTVTRMNDYPMVFTKNGFKIALLNYTYGTNGIPTSKPNIVNRIDTALIRKDLIRAKKYNPDIIISFLHWGNEYQSLPSSFQKSIADFCFDNGSDLVIGAHPHVVQPMEWRKEKNQVVVYSLGNFVSGQRKRYTDGGAMVRIDFQKILKDDSVFRSIDTVGYSLEWVHRDANKVYTILPVPVDPTDTLAFSIDKISKDAFEVFAEDARGLFKKHNINVGEYRFNAMDTSIYYAIEFDSLSQKIRDTLSNKRLLFYGIEEAEPKTEMVAPVWYIGGFRRLEKAEELRTTLLLEYPSIQTKIVKYVKDVRQDP